MVHTYVLPGTPEKPRYEEGQKRKESKGKGKRRENKKRKRKMKQKSIDINNALRVQAVTVYRLTIRLPAKSALTWPVV